MEQLYAAIEGWGEGTRRDTWRRSGGGGRRVVLLQIDFWYRGGVIVGGVVWVEISNKLLWTRRRRWMKRSRAIHINSTKKKSLQQPEGQASFWILAVQDWKGKADLSRVSIQLLEQLLSKCALEQDVNPRLVQGGCFNGQQIRTRVCVISPV